MDPAGPHQTKGTPAQDLPPLDTTGRSHTPSPEVPSPEIPDKLHRDQRALKKKWAELWPPDEPLVMHKSTSVLLLHWDFEKKDADFDVSSEVSDLREVFENDYHFKVTTKKFTTERRNPTLQATAHVTGFAEEQDEENGLLIIYYAGHGGASKVQPEFGNITLSGKSFDAQTRRDMTIEWSKVENILAAVTKSDVLEIFDCCHAGLMCRPAYRSVSRNFELLAACGAQEQTPACGKESFTSAMTWALKELSKLKGFYTPDLLRKIQEAPGFPRMQSPQVYSGRMETQGEHLYIAPHSRDGVQGNHHPKAVYRAQRDKEVQQQELLDLRFQFERKITDQDLEAVAREMKHSICRLHSPVLRVSALGKYSHKEEALLMASRKEDKEEAVEAEAVEALTLRIVSKWRRLAREGNSPLPISRTFEEELGAESSRHERRPANVLQSVVHGKDVKERERDGRAARDFGPMFWSWVLILFLSAGAPTIGWYLLHPEQQKVVMNLIWLNVTRLGGDEEAVNPLVGASYGQTR